MERNYVVIVSMLDDSMGITETYDLCFSGKAHGPSPAVGMVMDGLRVEQAKQVMLTRAMEVDKVPVVTHPKITVAWR